MKSFFILLLFVIVIYITYKYSYQKYYTDKIQIEIKYILPPLNYLEQYKLVDLKKQYYDMFNFKEISNKLDLSDKKTLTRMGIKPEKTFIPQQNFLSFYS